MPESSSEFTPKQEINNKPDVLWRGFTVDPNKLNVEMFKQPLFAGTVSKDDSTKIGDGNELGVYMSTNKKMVEGCYTHFPLGLSIKAPTYSDKGSVTNKIELPQCGVVVKINTEDLNIRHPQIISHLKGVYNNGFQGDEYIADQVPAKNYQVVKLVLKKSANDNTRFSIDIPDGDSESLKTAIEKIQAEFESSKQEAIKFANFLETMDPRDRYDSFFVQKEWKNYQELNK